MRRWTTGIYFVGYPKTGNTWTRLLLGRYLQQVCDLEEPPLFDSYDAFGRCQRACIGPAMHFTHAPLVWEEQGPDDLDLHVLTGPYRGRPVVLIVRYPLDVLVSLWMQQRYRTEPPYAGDLPAFLADPNFGLEKLLRFYAIWAREQGRSPGLHVLRYEDLTTDTYSTARTLLGFLGIRVDERALDSAVQAASFASMQRLEVSGDGPRYRSTGLSVFATGDRSNPDALHVRRGAVGGYLDYLEQSQARALEARISSGMPSVFGYSVPPLRLAHVE